MPDLPADTPARLAAQGARPPGGMRRLRARRIERRRQAGVVRIALHFRRLHFTLREPDTVKLGLQFVDAARQRVNFAFFTHQPVFDPLELRFQSVERLTLLVNDSLLMLAKDALEVGELLD